MHDARNFDEYTQVLAGDTTNKMAFLGGEEGAGIFSVINKKIRDIQYTQLIKLNVYKTSI
jgi:hypothetical protein